MEQIKKYNYKDPLYQKGDPFGATEAKVAHVNAVIDELTTIDSEVVSIESRVTALENAPAPEAATEYYINGSVMSKPGGDGFGNAEFKIAVYSHNTPVRNLNNQFENIITFQNSGSGTYSLLFQGANITADLGNGEELCNVTRANISSVTVNFENQLAADFGSIGKAFINLSIDPDLQTNAALYIIIATLRTYTLLNTSGTFTTVRTDIPITTAAQFANVFNFQIKFSEFTVVPV